MTTADALEAMNREKVSSILQYLDDVDAESSVSSIAPSFRGVYQSQQQQLYPFAASKAAACVPQTGGDDQQWSPSPSMPSASVVASRQANSRSAGMLPLGGGSVSVGRGVSMGRSPSLAGAASHLQQQQQHHVDAEGSIVSGATASAQYAHSNLRRKVGAIVAERDAAVLEAERLRRQVAELEERERGKVKAVREQADEEGAKTRRQMQSAVDEHLKCIRKLLAEKEGLIKKVEGLQSEVAAADSKRDGEVKRLRELHEKSLSELRARLAAQERVKRDEWAQKEAKRIKESTMKAMEPDIALLLNRHKAEKRRLEEELAEAQRRRDELAASKERESAEYRSRLVRELEAAQQREREEFRQRMQDESERMVRAVEAEKRAQEERRAALERGHEEVRAALVQQVTDMARKVADLERREQERQCSSATETATAVARAQQELAEQHRQMREALDRERQGLAASVQGASEQLIEARTAEIRQRCVAERDAAIARIVERLEAEQVRALTESRDAEKRWRDLNAQLQREAERLRTELDCTAAHLRSAKEAVAERDARIQQLQEQMVSSKHAQSMEAAQFEGAFERRMASLNTTWEQRVQALQAEHIRNTQALTAEVEHLRRQMTLMREEHATETKVAAQKHSAELAVINERVTLTLNKKEAQLRQMADTIASLERQLLLREEELASHDALLTG